MGSADGGGLDLGQLRTFLAVYRAGSVTAAARQVRLSQPTVTTQLQLLERRLGRQLFERLPRGVAPTAAADDLAARLAGPMDALAVIAGEGPAEPDGQPPVQLAGPADLLAVLALPALASLAVHKVRISATAGTTEELLGGLRTGRFDLALSPMRPRGRTVRAEPLAVAEFVLVAAPELAARIDTDRLRIAGPVALRGLPLVSYAADLPMLRRYWRHVFGARLDADSAMVMADLRAVATVAQRGGGITVLPRYLIVPQLDSGALVPLLEPTDPPAVTIHLARRRGAPVLPHVDLVWDTLRSVGRDW